MSNEELSEYNSYLNRLENINSQNDGDKRELTFFEQQRLNALGKKKVELLKWKATMKLEFE